MRRFTIEHNRRRYVYTCSCLIVAVSRWYDAHETAWCLDGFMPLRVEVESEFAPILVNPESVIRGYSYPGSVDV